MTHLIILFLQLNVVDTLKNEADSNYETGVLIGSFLPFLLLATVAVWMFYRVKKADRKD
ncbi:hypothetical protein [Flavobacterium cellulosilyticum]|uniref:hypothetical protein n=1 Tax=Flavobacterium cellulosilyticum TaxID=2541731 RepID=UPI00140503C4|nr:hypothetical protein [Flavobacterium cellulosilyticum]